MKWLLGQLVRYGDAPNSLMKVDNVAGERIYGKQLMGGRTGVNFTDLQVETEEDWQAWDDMAWFRDALNRRMGHG